MKLGYKELVMIIGALDILQEADFESELEEDIDFKNRKKLLIKLSKELYRRGYSTIISKHYIN